MWHVLGKGGPPTFQPSWFARSLQPSLVLLVPNLLLFQPYHPSNLPTCHPRPSNLPTFLICSAPPTIPGPFSSKPLAFPAVSPLQPSNLPPQALQPSNLPDLLGPQTSYFSSRITPPTFQPATPGPPTFQPSWFDRPLQPSLVLLVPNLLLSRGITPPTFQPATPAPPPFRPSYFSSTLQPSNLPTLS